MKTVTITYKINYCCECPYFIGGLYCYQLKRQVTPYSMDKECLLEDIV